MFNITIEHVTLYFKINFTNITNTLKIIFNIMSNLLALNKT